MTQNRIRIVDVADALGLSTATVSNVIHGKTEKISDETVKRVQQELERSGYIPNMAGILLARNNSRIIGVVVNDHEKYEGRVLEDGFVMSSLNALSHEVNEKGYFLMIKTTSDIREIPVFASMWNMDGLILIGFCEADYESLRNQMRISFVVYDGYFEKCSKVVNLVIDHYNGGYQAGKYLKELGHKKALCIADNFICMDKERIEGFRKAFEPGETYRWEIPKTERERMCFYEDKYIQLLKSNFAAIILGIASGVVTSLLTVLVLSMLMGLTHEQYVTMLPKSITTAIGMGVSEELGGYVTITVAVIVVTGVIGNILAEFICNVFKITEPIAKGVAIGTSAHAVGTAKAIEMGEIEGAMSSLSIAVAGILTVIGASVFANFL